jgi:hypothetical protein
MIIDEFLKAILYNEINIGFEGELWKRKFV